MQFTKLHDQLIAAGITIPAGVTTARSALTTFAAREPQPQAPNPIADAYRNGDTDAEVAAIASTVHAQPAMLSGYRVALTRYDRDLGAAIATAATALTTSIDAALAETTDADTSERSNLNALRAQVNAA